MPLVASGLKAVIVSELNAQYGAPADSTEQDRFATAVSNAVINYLKANTVVTTADTGEVTTGVGTGGTVVGTGTGTIA